MKYIKFTIENYRGIPKIVLDLTKKPATNIFTLVGLNESGKTTILEAINRFTNDISKENSHTLIPKSRQYDFTGKISITAELELDLEDEKFIKSYLQRKWKFFIADNEESIKITRSYNFESSVPLEGEWKTKNWVTSFIGKTKQAKKTKRLAEWKNEAWQDLANTISKRFLPKILYYPNFLFEFPERIYLEKTDGEERTQTEYRGILQDILDSIEDSLTVEKHLLERMKNKEDKAHKNALDSLLNKIAEKLNNVILKEWDEIFGSGQKKEVEIKFDNDGDTGYFIELKIKQGSDSYSINDRSLGFRWFFSFLIFTAFRRSRASDPGETLFLLDEPASNLHQRSQQKLLKALDGIVSDCKLIYSTHSHHLINPKWLAGTYIVRNEAINYGNPEESKTTETKIETFLYKNFVAEYPDEIDHFKPILDALDYVPSKLEVVPSTAFTEGENDYYTFKYIAEVIFDGNHEIHFYPGAGVDKYADVFRLYLAWDRKFIGVFDSDPGGKRAKKRYIDEIGPDIEDRVFTLEDVNSKWKNLNTEDLFSESEKIKIIQTSFEDHQKTNGFHKSKFNTAIQQLYINNEPFELNKTTKQKFEKIFEFIAEKINALK
ncbi:MAG: AAA family ATPase [Bacteroidetes bacterium]|nr:AAA family ATPase [Bacteroidota bacterium]